MDSWKAFFTARNIYELTNTCIFVTLIMVYLYYGFAPLMNDIDKYQKQTHYDPILVMSATMGTCFPLLVICITPYQWFTKPFFKKYIVQQNLREDKQ